MNLLIALIAETGSLIIRNERLTIFEAKETGEIVLQVSVLSATNIKYFGDFYIQETA